MDFIEDEILGGELVPVLLGTSVEAMQTARRFFQKFGTVSHVFSDRVPLTARLSFCMKYHVIRHRGGDTLMLTALRDYACQLENADVILYLLPCTVDYANFVWRNREALEPYFVIADQPEMQRVWYGEEIDRREG